MQGQGAPSQRSSKGWEHARRQRLMATSQASSMTSDFQLPKEPYKSACIANERQSWQGSKMLQPPPRLCRGEEGPEGPGVPRDSKGSRGTPPASWSTLPPLSKAGLMQAGLKSASESSCPKARAMQSSQGLTMLQLPPFSCRRQAREGGKLGARERRGSRA